MDRRVQIEPAIAPRFADCVLGKTTKRHFNRFVQRLVRMAFSSRQSATNHDRATSRRLLPERAGKRMYRQAWCTLPAAQMANLQRLGVYKTAGADVG